MAFDFQDVSNPGAKMMAVLRILIGLIFLWGALDKIFGLGFPTSPGGGWIDGFSPSAVLPYAFDGPFAQFLYPIAGNVITDALLIGGLSAMGVSFTLGLGRKISTVAGVIFLGLMYLVVFPIPDNPVLDYHIVYIVLVVAFMFTGAWDEVGFGKAWCETELVKRFPILM